MLKGSDPGWRRPSCTMELETLDRFLDPYWRLMPWLGFTLMSVSGSYVPMEFSIREDQVSELSEWRLGGLTVELEAVVIERFDTRLRLSCSQGGWRSGRTEFLASCSDPCGEVLGCFLSLAAQECPDGTELEAALGRLRHPWRHALERTLEAFSCTLWRFASEAVSLAGRIAGRVRRPAVASGEVHGCDSGHGGMDAGKDMRNGGGGDGNE